MPKSNCLVLVRFVFGLCVISGLAGITAAQTFKTVHDGVEYAEMTRQLLDKQPVKINLLRLDLKKVRIDTHHALDAAIGTETTSSIATRHGAVAAINAGFFRLDRSKFAGDVAGVFMIDGTLLSESVNDRSAVGIINGAKRTEIEFGRIRTRAIVGFGIDSEFAFDGINRERKPNEIILFTPNFGRSTMTDTKGPEIVLTDCETDDGRWRCGRAEVFENNGNAPIPRDGFVISIGNDALQKSNSVLYFAERAGSKQQRNSEDTFRVVLEAEPLDAAQKKFFATAEDITNGVPRLIKNRRVNVTWQEEKAARTFAESRHPRTAVAKLKNGKLLMVTVDGRQPNVSVGMNLNELAEFLLELGAVDAMNLDGGGSTTMVLRGKVVNTPSDKTGERKVSDALLVTLRAKRK